MNTYEKAQLGLTLIADAVLEEAIAQGKSSGKGFAYGPAVKDALGLRVETYPTGSITQGKTGWTMSAAIRNLQDRGLITYELVIGRGVITPVLAPADSKEAAA